MPDESSNNSSERPSAMGEEEFKRSLAKYRKLLDWVMLPLIIAYGALWIRFGLHWWEMRIEAANPPAMQRILGLFATMLPGACGFYFLLRYLSRRCARSSNFVDPGCGFPLDARLREVRRSGKCPRCGNQIFQITEAKN
jgi:hypothetical protein